MIIKKSSIPYNNIIIKDFFSEEKLIQFEKILSNLEYEYSSCDLYDFYRTSDFSKIPETKIIIEEFLNKINLFEKEFNKNLSKKDISIHSLLLKKTNYLLTHDDKIEKRKIAFILNFSNFKKEDGGGLNLYDKDFKLVKSIYPKRGNLIAFEVSDFSFHNIEEVKKDKKRLTIGGWFY